MLPCSVPLYLKKKAKMPENNLENKIEMTHYSSELLMALSWSAAVKQNVAGSFIKANSRAVGKLLPEAAGLCHWLFNGAEQISISTPATKAFKERSLPRQRGALFSRLLLTFTSCTMQHCGCRCHRRTVWKLLLSGWGFVLSRTSL